LHPSRNIQLAVQHTPNIDMVWSLNVKHQMRIARQGPRLQARQIQFVGIAWGTRSWVAADVGKCAFQLINEANGRTGCVNL
jgi:predicted secreted protein